MAREIARGDAVAPLLLKMPLYPQPFVFMGKQYIAQPLTQYGQFLYITSSGSEAYYMQNDILWAESPQNLFRNGLFIGEFARGGASAKWIIPVYKAMVAFAVQVVPGGKYAGRALSLTSIAVYWSKHETEINQGISLAVNLCKDLREIYTKCPKLGSLMLIVALEQSATQLSKEIRDKGLAKVVTSNLDFDKYMEDIATFFGALVKLAISGNSSAPAGWLAKKGLLNVAKVAGVLHKAYKVSRVVQKGMVVAGGPGIKDTQQLAAKFVTEFALAGVTLSRAHVEPIVHEGCLSDPAKLSRLESLKTTAEQLEALVTKLCNAAENELFLV